MLSDEILEALEQLDVLEAEGKQLETELAKQQADQEARVEEVTSRVEELKQELARVEAELEESEKEIPAEARIDYKRLIGAKGEDALAPVDGQSCGGCFQTLTTNDIDRLQMSMLIRCPNCNAFLYFPEDRTVR